MIIGLVGGILLGCLGVRLMTPASEETREIESSMQSRRHLPERWMRQSLAERAGMGEVNTRSEFLEQRRVNRSESARSPYRGEAWERNWLNTMPIEEVVALLESGEVRGSSDVWTVFKRWVAVEPEAALLALDRLTLTRDEKSAGVTAVYGYWVKQDPLGLLARFETMEQTLERESRAWNLIQEWQKEDPLMALKTLDRLGKLYAHPKTMVPRVRDGLLAALLKKDPEGAAQWVEELANPEEKKAMNEALVTARLSNRSASEAVEYILSESNDENLQNRLKEYWRAWTRQSPSDAVEGLMALPEDHSMWRGHVPDVVSSATVMAISMEKVDVLMESLSAMPSGERKRKILQGMVWGAANNDIDLGQRLIEQLPESRERRNAIDFFVGELASENMATAEEWVGALESSSSRDTAVKRFSLELVGSDPVGAAEWADSIEGAQPRQSTREKIHRRWREQDAEAADSWKESW